MHILRIYNLKIIFKIYISYLSIIYLNNNSKNFNGIRKTFECYKIWMGYKIIFRGSRLNFSWHLYNINNISVCVLLYNRVCCSVRGPLVCVPYPFPDNSFSRTWNVGTHISAYKKRTSVGIRGFFKNEKKIIELFLSVVFASV